MGVLDELQCHPMSGPLHSTPCQRLEILQRCPHLGIYRRKGGKPLNSFFFSSLFFFPFGIFLAFFCFCVQGHKFSFVGPLMDFLRLYLVVTLSFGLLGTANVTSWLGVISTSGRLSGWFMNLVALLMSWVLIPSSQRGV